MYRGFGYLHSRVLLDLQDRIVALERELDKKDKMDFQNGLVDRLCSRAQDEDETEPDSDARPRVEILDDIRKLLEEYDDFLAKARDVVSFQRPSDRDYSSVKDWMSRRSLLVKKEKAFIRHKEDVLTLNSGREWCGFDGFVEDLLLKFDCRLIRWIFVAPELREKTVDKAMHYYTRSRVDKLIGILITIMIFILLVLPVIAMYQLTTFGAKPQSTFSAVGVLVVFTLLFSAAMSLLTKARRHELFAASAAYCAVLVVFISNFGTIA
ncbi:hypothetical protein MMC18_006137 [Xylographa bjoerkii]|nr:hypothetical protein [Xylographa bjoerkii]